LQAGFDRAEHDPQDQPDHEQVAKHLEGGGDPGQVSLGGDVAKADGGEHRDGEVQGVGAAQRLAERPGIGIGHPEVGGREQQQEQRDRGSQGLDRAQARILRPQDGSDLPGDDPGQCQQPDHQAQGS
jgi:hypothetical protein